MIRKQLFLCILFIVGSITLTACSSSGTFVTTIIPSTSQQDTQVPITARPNPTLTLTTKTTARPTATHTSTPTSTPTPKPTRIPSPTIPNEIEQAEATIDAFGSLCPEQYRPVISPDGQWIASTSKDLGTGEPGLMVANVDGSRTWQVSNNLPEIQQSGPGSLMGNRWSHDGASLYISLFPSIDGNMGNFINGTALFTLNLNTGKFTSLILGTGDPWDFYSFTISPDDRYLVYVFHEPPHTLQIRDLIAGTNFQIDLKPSCGIGNFVWSPNEEKIAYLIGNCTDGSFSDTLSVGVITINSRSEQVFSANLVGYPRITWTSKYPAVENHGISNGNLTICKISIDLDKGRLVPILPYQEMDVVDGNIMLSKFSETIK